MQNQGTRLETDEDVKRALQMHRPAARAGALMPGQPAPADDAPPLFRPTQRPVTPVLTVFDDGVEKGESFRIRKEQFVFGRAEGDVVFPHDVQMSGRHAELRRTFSNDKYRWHLIDLNSTNGTYVRIGQAVLQHGQEFMVGRTRLRFEVPAVENGHPPRPPLPGHQATCTWQSGVNHASAPSITELTPTASGNRTLITRHEIWLGKDGSYCQLMLPDDPFVSARHARIFKNAEGRWVLENNQSVNGVWLRIEQIALKGACRFLMGEQLFMIRIPSR